MNALKNKIKSQRGASITFALLLFLVCAIISSVVIVAATAVGGRASKMAELDQRYYAVNSAAELLRDVLEGQKVTVEIGTNTEWEEDQDGKRDEDTITITTEPIKLTLNDERETSTDPLIIGAAVQLVKEKLEEELNNEATNLVKNELEEAIESLPVIASLPELKLTASGTGIPQKALDVTMTAAGVNNGVLLIKAFNTENANGAYTLGLTFKADVVQNNNERTSKYAPQPKIEDGKIVPGEYKREVSMRKTKVSTISWKLIDVKNDMIDLSSTTEESEGENDG